MVIAHNGLKLEVLLKERECKMNLTYTTTDTGYVIFNNGIAWIIQEGYIPPEFIDEVDKSFAKSAELNIAKIIADDEASKNAETDLENMQTQIDELGMSILSLIGMI